MRNLFNTYYRYPAHTNQLNQCYNTNNRTTGARVEESDEAYTLRLIIPGAERADISLSTTGNILKIIHKANKEPKEEESHQLINSITKDFEKEYKLPENSESDNIRANYLNGILNITIPKAKEADKPDLNIQIN